MKRDGHAFNSFRCSDSALDDGFRSSHDHIAVDARKGIDFSASILCRHSDFPKLVDENLDQIRGHSNLYGSCIRSQLEDHLGSIFVHDHTDLPIERRGVVICHSLISLSNANRLAFPPASAFDLPETRT
jgi:hypothetical protein